MKPTSGPRGFIGNAVFTSGRPTKPSSFHGRSRNSANCQSPIVRFEELRHQPNRQFGNRQLAKFDPPHQQTVGHPGTMANKFFKPFLWVVTGCGSLAFIYSSVRLEFGKIDSSLALLVAMALLLSTRITIPIPRLSSKISVSDTFVFLVLLLYGSAAAVVVGAVEALLSSLRFSRKPRTVIFNWSAAAVSVLITGKVL